MSIDPEKQPTYRGERMVESMLSHADGNTLVELAGSRVVLPAERHFACLESMQRYVDQVIALRPVQDLYPGATAPKIVNRRGFNQASFRHVDQTIRIPSVDSRGRWAMREMTLLHELAHFLAPAGSHHDSKFRSTFAFLARAAMGPEVGLALQVCWHNEGMS
jgi:putative metallohydrolase (TIGR04338 family)